MAVATLPTITPSMLRRAWFELSACPLVLLRCCRQKLESMHNHSMWGRRRNDGHKWPLRVVKTIQGGEPWGQACRAQGCACCRGHGDPPPEQHLVSVYTGDQEFVFVCVTVTCHRRTRPSTAPTKEKHRMPHCVRVCVWWGGLEAWASAFDPAFDPPLQSTFTHTPASQLRCRFLRPADGTPLVGVEATCRQELEFFVEGLNQPDTDDEAAGPAGMLDPALAAALGHPVGAAAYRFGGRGAGGKKRGKKPRYFR